MLSKGLFGRIHSSLSANSLALSSLLSSVNVGKPSINDQVSYPASTSVLQDTFGRNHTYLRISLTEKCNLRCTYCMPEEGVKLTQSDKLLQGHEIVKLVSFFVKNGVNKVRFTGGEPLIRKDCVEIIQEVGKINGLVKIAITTNGINLAKKIKDLKQAGLNQLNISLDTLESKKFEFIAKRNGWSKVMGGIEAAIQEGFSPVKVFLKYKQYFFRF